MALNNEHQFSPWLIPHVVENILRKSENDETLKVLSIDSKPAVAGGDNYMSDISRVHVEFTRSQGPDDKVIEKKTLIFKVSFSKDSPAGNLSEASKVFETEIEMVTKTLESMSTILNEKNYCLSPRVFHTQIGDPSYLVLEDLAARGFRTADRRVGLDLDHCLFVMRGLAKFHASSVALYEKDPNSIKNYNKGMYYKECSENFRKMIADGFRTMSREVKDWPDLGSSYSEKYSKLAEVCYDKGVECAEPRENDFNVLNHGDTWVNNLMFRYDDKGKVVGQIFLDFQLPVWSSPAYDLHYFMHTSPVDEVRIRHWDELIAEYTKTLNETMLRIKCKTKPPSLDWMKECLKKREFLGVLASIMTFPFVLLDKDKAVSLSDLISTSGQMSSPGFKDERYRQIMIGRSKDWNSRGILDI